MHTNPAYKQFFQLRVILPLVCALLGLVVFILTIVARTKLIEERDKVVKSLEGRDLDDTYEWMTAGWLIISILMTLRTAPTIVYFTMGLGKTEKNQERSLFEALGPRLTFLLSAMNIFWSLVLAILITVFMAGKQIDFDPWVPEPELLAERAGIEIYYFKHPSLVAILVLSWILLLMNGVNFGQECLYFRKYLRSITYTKTVPSKHNPVGSQSNPVEPESKEAF
ncbi:hypothetical protein BY996DRAFT_6664817 [Phakopsora pachyrhizi]|nr:hypothetical protein BY996DRAFT_6664817 [Phakopsora pachyrhizi]